MTLWPPAGYSVFCPPCVYFCCASDSASHLYILPLLVSRPFSCSSLCVNYSACVYPGLSVPSCQIDFTLVLAYLVSSKGPVVCLPGSCLVLPNACPLTSLQKVTCLFFLCLDCFPVSVYSVLGPFLCFCNLHVRPDFIRWSFQVPCHKQTTS